MTRSKKLTPTQTRVLEALSDGEWRSAWDMCLKLGIWAGDHSGYMARSAESLMDKGLLDMRWDRHPKRTKQHRQYRLGSGLREPYRPVQKIVNRNALQFSLGI